MVSAGTDPTEEVHPMAIQVMKEVNIDLGTHLPKKVDQFINRDFDYVITVCDHANETCPVFMGKVKNRLHMGFEDPAKVTGTEEKVLTAFRNVRDEIKNQFWEFYQTIKQV